VESKILKPKLAFPRIFLFGGLALLFGSGNLPLVGIFSIIFAEILWFLSAPRYSIIIHMAAGDIQSLLSENFGDIESLLTALNVAIALRESPE